MRLLLDKRSPNGRRRRTDDGYSKSQVLLEESKSTPKQHSYEDAWYAYTRYIITFALEEKIRSMTIAERASDDHPIRFGICITGEDPNIY
jgi:hypothetical protein